MYDENIMKIALSVSYQSLDESTKVGCVITNQDNEILSVGFNKIKNINLSKEDIDYININKEVKKYVYDHAEMIALSRLKHTTEELNIYITSPSCIKCTTEYLLNSNYTFKNIYYIDRGTESFFTRYKIKEALELMQYKKINVKAIGEFKHES